MLGGYSLGRLPRACIHADTEASLGRLFHFLPRLVGLGKPNDCFNHLAANGL